MYMCEWLNENYTTVFTHVVRSNVTVLLVFLNMKNIATFCLEIFLINYLVNYYTLEFQKRTGNVTNFLYKLKH